MTTENTTPTNRPQTEIKSEYDQVARIVGDKEYRKKIIEIEIETHYKKMYDLNVEYQKSNSTLPPLASVTGSTPDVA